MNFSNRLSNRLVVCLLVVASLACSTLTGSAPEDTAVPVAENTPPPPTSAPVKVATDTSPPPTEAPVDDGQVEIPTGWKVFDGDGVVLALPGTFNGGNLQEDLDILLEALEGLGPDYAAIVDAIQQNPDIFVLWVFDSELGADGFLTNVNVTRDNVLSAVTVDMYLDSALTQYPFGFDIVERGHIEVDGEEAGRVLIEFDINGAKGKQVQYVIKSGTTIYAVTCATSVDEFEVRLPIFDHSIQTFRVIP